MKEYRELTLKGKWLRCKKALERLEIIHHGHPSDRIYQFIYYIEDNGLKYSEEEIERLRKEILENNKYHGYSNYCPDKKIVELLR